MRGPLLLRTSFKKSVAASRSIGGGETITGLSFAVSLRAAGNIAFVDTRGQWKYMSASISLPAGIILSAAVWLLFARGLALTLPLDHVAEGTFFGFAGMELSPVTAVAGVSLAMGLGLAAGLMPAWGAYRARVAETLRGV